MSFSGDFINSLEREEDTSRWSSGLEKLNSCWKRFKDSWMDMLPMSALSEEQRTNQYLADVAQENAERLTRSETALQAEKGGMLHR